MTEQQARTAANVVMAAGAAGALVYILRKRPLRRLAVQLAHSWVKGPLVVWAAAELRRAWLESGSHTSQRANLASR
jgi:hypothetical protein